MGVSMCRCVIFSREVGQLVLCIFFNLGVGFYRHNRQLNTRVSGVLRDLLLSLFM